MKDTKQFILETTFRLFLQKTFKEVTMQEIVERTGLSKGAFYHHFKSKEQLFAEVIGNFFASLMDFKSDTGSDKTLHTFYHECADKSAMFDKLIDEKSDAETTINFYFMIFDALKLLPGFREKMQEQQKKELDTWIRVIKKAKETGEITSGMSNKNIAMVFIYTGDGIALDLMLGRKHSTLKKDTLKIWDEFYKSLV